MALAVLIFSEGFGLEYISMSVCSVCLGRREKNVLCVQHGFGLSLIHIVHSKKIAKMQKAGQRERERFSHT